jgi:hypothetical protein
MAPYADGYKYTSDADRKAKWDARCDARVASTVTAATWTSGVSD